MSILRIACVCVGVTGFALAHAQKEALPSGEEIVARVNERDVGATAQQDVRMVLTEKGGKTRERQMKSFRRYFGAEKRMVLFFVAPANIKGTALLIHAYADPERSDDQWLYLPATRKVRRIPPAERGSAFLGTDFTFEDMQYESRAADLADHTLETLRTEEVDGRPCYVVEAVPRSERLAREIGYSKVRLWIDRESWVIRRSEAWDQRDRLYKRISLRDFRQVQGVWTPATLEAENLLTGHSTLFIVEKTAYNEDIPEDMFGLRKLEQGP